MKAILGNILKNRAYEITINAKYNVYQRGLASMMYKIFNKKIGSWARVNEELSQELHKPVI